MKDVRVKSKELVDIAAALVAHGLQPFRFWAYGAGTHVDGVRCPYCKWDSSARRSHESFSTPEKCAYLRAKKIVEESIP